MAVKVVEEPVRHRASVRENRRITVGADGSESGRRAVWWAARQADLLGVDLLVLHAAPADASRTPASPEDSGVAGAVNAFPTVRVRLSEPTGEPLGVLATASVESAAVVIGACGRHHRQGFGLGALVLPLIAAATCDVVVVGGREDAVRGVHRTITAAVRGGVDEWVLRRAARLSRATGCRLRVLRAGGTAPVSGTGWEVVADPRPPHEAVARCGDTDLLVIGQGDGRTRPTGPVTRAALYHAPCPVLVVKPERPLRW